MSKRSAKTALFVGVQDLELREDHSASTGSAGSFLKFLCRFF